jgi:Fur family ferric uptake transcriptional regulator
MNKTQIKDLLQKRKLKATNNRLNLLLKMAEYGSAISYKDIQKALNPIDRVTLYRTIESLKEKGIIHKAFQENNEVYYAICGNTCGENHHHHEHIHFKCLKCNTITCEKLDQTLEFSLSNFIVNKISINFEGVCKFCK